MSKNEGGKLFKKQKKPKIYQLIEIIDTPVIEQDIYTISRTPYISSEFIPPNIIPIIIEHHFTSAEMIIRYSDKHALYKIKIGDLLNSPIKNWEYNRPPDLIRCNDLARKIYTLQKPIDTMIYLSFNNKNEVFEIYDGIHRITSLNIIKEENSKQLELLCPGEFGSNNDANWLYEQYLVVNIRFNTSLGEVIEAFRNLNECQPVPELYIRDQTKDKREMIETIVNDWQCRFSAHFTSASIRQNKGNTNRDKFINLLDKIYDKYKINTNDCSVLQRLLDNANNKISINIPSDIPIKSRVKCKDSGCYLFLKSNNELESFI